MISLNKAQASELKHAASQWAALSSLATAKKYSGWPIRKRAIASREIAKRKFLTLLENLKE